MRLPRAKRRLVASSENGISAKDTIPAPLVINTVDDSGSSPVLIAAFQPA